MNPDQRLGIDARLYGTKHGGIGRYIQNLIAALEKIDIQNKYFIFLGPDNFDDYQPAAPNFKKVLADFSIYGWREQLFWPIMLRRYRLDLVHFPHFNVPLFYRRPFVLTIHDLIISHYPDSRATTLPIWLYRLKLLVYRLVVRSASRRARKIIAVSRFTKDDIIRILKIKPEKIRVIYEGVSLPKIMGQDRRSWFLKLGLRQPYLLYVGSAYPHKNLSRLLLAFKELTTINENCQLVLVGKINYFYRRLKKEIDQLGLMEKVKLTGYCSDEELVYLYQKAQAYVFPSLLEGFGLPPLEAQQYDLPVVSSRASCLPEILGQSSIYFDPFDIQDMSRQINRILTDDQLRQELIAAGRENLKKYSWSKMGLEVYSLYQSS